MKSAAPVCELAIGAMPTPARSLCPARPEVQARSRLADYLELTKPRVAVLVLFTVAVGALWSQRGFTPNYLLLLHVLIGTALVAAGASALNQVLERHRDGLMRRTENRPLPAGRLQSTEVWVFGLSLATLGLAWLALGVRQPLTVAIAGFTFASYVFLYTPLKSKTTLNTLVGAVPGALPPVIGWTGVRGTLDTEALVLFAILFLWQVPHFLAIAWMYRGEYARAGMCMLPVQDDRGVLTGRQMVGYSLALIPVSLAPVLGHQAGIVYALGALGLGLGFCRAALVFWKRPDLPHARLVLHASLIYLPALLALLLVDGTLQAFAR